MPAPHTQSPPKSVTFPAVPLKAFAREFKRKAVVHPDQHDVPIASAAPADDGAAHAVAIDALAVFDVVHARPLFAPGLRPRDAHLSTYMQGNEAAAAGPDRASYPGPPMRSRTK